MRNAAAQANATTTTQQAPSSPDAKLVAAIVGILAVNAGFKATADKIATLLKVPVAAVLPALRLATMRSVSYGVSALPSANATRRAQAMEPSYRAAFLLASARRLAAATQNAVPSRDYLNRERAYFDQHMAAVRNRRESAAAVDRAAARYGAELGWYAKMDSHTSEECRQANGRNFVVSRVPAIGYPGAVHPNCRCKPGKPFSNENMVYGITRSA